MLLSNRFANKSESIYASFAPIPIKQFLAVAILVCVFVLRTIVNLKIGKKISRVHLV